jgi:hypothetical protein
MTSDQPGGKAPETIPDDKEIRNAINEFNIKRSEAINAYAALEQSIANLFSTLLGANIIKSYVVFSRIINVRSRNEILSELMRISYGDEYKTFFKSLLAELSKIDVTRNNIVHWILLTTHSDQPFDTERDIAPHRHPNIFSEGRMLKPDVIEFRRRADFAARILEFFNSHLLFGDRPAPGGRKAWSEIFHQRVCYPPPKDHPLYYISTKP